MHLSPSTPSRRVMFVGLLLAFGPRARWINEWWLNKYEYVGLKYMDRRRLLGRNYSHGEMISRLHIGVFWFLLSGTF